MTSGTIFAHHKLPIRDYLLAIAVFCNGAKGISALQLSRDLDVQYKTAFVLAHKLREAMGAELGDGKVGGKVEVDGAYFGGHVRPKNKASERVNRSLSENRSGKRLCVVVMREREGRALPYVFNGENLSIQTVKAYIEKGSTVYVDEAPHWTALESKFPIKVINHGAEYATKTANTNQAESYFSRLRRAEIGTHHHIAGPYLEAYADEMAWRENNRRVDNGMQCRTIASAGLHHPVSRIWFRYWQRAEDIPPELKKQRRKPAFAARWFDRRLDILLDYGVLAAIRASVVHDKPSSWTPAFAIGATLLMGVLAASAQSLVQMVAGMGLAAALLLCAWIDWRNHILPDVVVLPLLAVGLLLAMSWQPFVGAGQASCGALLGWGMASLIQRLGRGRHGRLGTGDIKLLAAIGAWLGPLAVTIILLTSSALIVLYFICCRDERRTGALSFGPAMATGSIFYLLFLFVFPNAGPIPFADAMADFSASISRCVEGWPVLLSGGAYIFVGACV